jgi:hypothetical protein
MEASPKAASREKTRMWGSPYLWGFAGGAI